jgi:hypothetical protein
VVPLEELSDLDQGHPGALADQIHGNVPGGRERTGAALGDQVADGERVVARGLLEDQLGGDLGFGLREEVFEGVLGEVSGDGLAREVGPRDDSDERALELTDVLVES